jgi:acyl carrier protein
MQHLMEPGGHMPASLRWVIIGGENALRERVKAWQQFGIPLINAYGLTEATVTSVVYTMPANEETELAWREFPIGRPIANTQAYILDEHLHPIPLGVIGELYLGGEGLGRGYINRPDMTAERFIPNPFSTERGARLYKTGDLVRHLPDGNIENLGRADTQVKVRGFRIELGEIESVLGKYPGVRESVVVTHQPSEEDKRLVAYIVCDPSQTPAVGELRAYLKDKLPEYMIPSFFVFIDALPVSPNGKIDRRALPTLEQFRPETTGEYVAPRTEVERILADLWEQVLRVERVGVNDNFFELGGHSLLATQLVSHIRETFSVELPLRGIFESPTVAEQVGLIGALTLETSEDDAELPQLLDSLEQLSEEEVKALLADKLGSETSVNELL